MTRSPHVLEVAGSAVQAAAGGSAQPIPVEQVPGVVGDTLLGLWKNVLGYLPFILASLVVVVLTGLLAAVAVRIGRRTLARSAMRHSLQALFIRFIRFGVWLVGLLVAAVIVFPNLTPTNVLGGLGVASIAFGLIFKEFFENFFAGVLILWRFPMDAGDYIECKDILGRVEDISVRMTLIRQVSDELVLVPNKFLTENPVRVLTNRGKRRVLEVINVGSAGTVEEAAEVLRRAAEGCATVDKGHRIEVLARCLCPSSVDIELAWWTDPDPYSVRRSRGEVLAAVKRALDEAGIEMPPPYRAVVFKNALGVEASVDGRGASPAREDIRDEPAAESEHGGQAGRAPSE